MLLSYWLRTIRNYVENNRVNRQECWEQIATSNLRMLHHVAFLNIGVLALYFGLAVIQKKSGNIQLSYFIGIILQTVFALFVHGYEKRLKWRTRVIQALCLFFVSAMYVLVLYNAAVADCTEPGICFAPLIILFSMLFLVPFWFDVVLVTVFTLGFLWLSFINKEAAVFAIDVRVAATTWVLALLADFLVLDIRLKGLRLHNEMMRLSSTDGLTGLMNKSAAESAARIYLASNSAFGHAALFVIDLDQFKQINDQMGHQMGDRALETVGDSLMKLFRSNDIVGRVGGDEFVALMKNTSDREMVANRADLICKTVSKTQLCGTSIMLTCSIGVAICTKRNCSYDALFKLADEALYRVKNEGKNGYRIA